MMESILAERSMFYDGDWHDGQWVAEVVDDATGELVLTAIATDLQPRVVLVRLTMELVRSLRAGVGLGEPEPSTNGGTNLRRMPMALPPAWVLDSIEHAYDPEHDAFPVTWTDMRLLRAVKDVAFYAEALEARVRTLEAAPSTNGGTNLRRMALALEASSAEYVDAFCDNCGGDAQDIQAIRRYGIWQCAECGRAVAGEVSE